MFHNKLVSHLILIIILVSSNCFADEKLVFSVDLIRHGDRTPADQIPRSYLNWKEGLGELTAKGIQQEIGLGKKLRMEYINQYHLLPNDFNKDTIYVRSTDYKRTIKSAEALLSGLYPLETRKPPNQKIIIHVVNVKDDNLLIVKPSKSIVAVINRYLKDHRFWKEKTVNLQKKLDYWSEATGLQLQNADQLRILADNLFIRQLYHLPLPKDINQEDADKIILLSDSVTTNDFKLKEVTNSTGRKFLQTVAAYLKQASQEKSPLKYALFLGHDASIMSVMTALGAPLETLPPYASRLNFSLIENNNHYYVKIHYNKKLVFVPFCKRTICTLPQFHKLGDNI
jgi:hypothetical protein